MLYPTFQAYLESPSAGDRTKTHFGSYTTPLDCWKSLLSDVSTQNKLDMLLEMLTETAVICDLDRVEIAARFASHVVKRAKSRKAEAAVIAALAYSRGEITLEALEEASCQVSEECDAIDAEYSTSRRAPALLAACYCTCPGDGFLLANTSEHAIEALPKSKQEEERLYQLSVLRDFWNSPDERRNHVYVLAGRGSDEGAGFRRLRNMTAERFIHCMRIAQEEVPALVYEEAVDTSAVTLDAAVLKHLIAQPKSSSFLSISRMLTDWANMVYNAADKTCARVHVKLDKKTIVKSK